MTIKNLQDDLILEIENVLKDITTKDKAGEPVAGVKGYAHRLPILEDDEEDPDRYYPYFIVRIDSAETEDDNDWWHVSVDIIIGIYDRSTYLGHETVLVIIQRILDRFVSDPKLKDTYRADQDPRAVVQEDDTYPYYFGGVGIKFSMPKIRRSKDYYA